jgi:hypothetical protein
MFVSLITEMTATMGAGADNLQEYLQSLCDICVRDLHKHTEEIGRESYRHVCVHILLLLPLLALK